MGRRLPNTPRSKIMAKHKTSKILAIDPGPEESAYVCYSKGKLLDFGKIPNNDMLSIIDKSKAERLVIEMIASYGMPVGATVFETCVWIGIFIHNWGKRQPVSRKPASRIYRKDVKMHLCYTMKAKDSNIRQAIIDRYPAIGGGKMPQIGTKKEPGPLYGVSKDVWAAIGVAITYDETSVKTVLKKKTAKKKRKTKIKV